MTTDKRVLPTFLGWKGAAQVYGQRFIRYVSIWTALAVALAMLALLAKGLAQLIDSGAGPEIGWALVGALAAITLILAGRAVVGGTRRRSLLIRWREDGIQLMIRWREEGTHRDRR